MGNDQEGSGLNNPNYLKVGACLVDINRREITAAGHSPQRITLKSLQVLLALAEKPGQVVGRDRLLQQVWPNTLPTEHVLTQAIGQLRKALGESRNIPEYFETISKGGYRLLADVEWFDSLKQAQDQAALSFFDESNGNQFGTDTAQDTDSPPKVSVSNSPDPPGPNNDAANEAHPFIYEEIKDLEVIGTNKRPKKNQQRLAYYYGSIACAIIATFFMTTFIFRSTKPQREGTSRNLQVQTITHSTGSETKPNLSPDGKYVAYVNQPARQSTAVIMMQATAQAFPKQISHPAADYHDDFPVWSPDGRKISFVRKSKQVCYVYVVTVESGKERRAAECYKSRASYYDWLPDGSGLIMGNLKGEAEKSSPLRVLNFASRQWQALKYPINAGDIDLDPHYSPDGRLIAFHRNTPHSNVLAITVDNGALSQLTNFKGTIRNFDWLSDGSGLIYNLATDRNAIYRYDFSSQKSFLLGELGRHLDVAERVPALAFELRRDEAGLFRYYVGSDEALFNRGPMRIFASSGSERAVVISPDGQRIAFFSDRSLTERLWIADIEDEDSARPIEDFTPRRSLPPVWSLDSQEIWVVGLKGDRRQIFAINANSRTIRPINIPEGEPLFLSFTDQPNQILIGIDTEENQTNLVRYDMSYSPWRRLATLTGVALAKFFVSDQGVYFTKYSEPGLFKTDLNLKHIKLVSPEVKLRLRWDISGSGIVYVSPGSCQLWWMPFNATRQSRCLEWERTSYGQPDFDSSGNWVYINRAWQENVDIGFFDLSPQ